MTVHFIGAGPGAPDLITLRGRDLIAASPVCLYAGSLVPAALLAYCPKDARIVNTASLSLDEIIAELAAAHGAGLSRWTLGALDKGALHTPIAGRPIDIAWRSDGAWLVTCLAGDGLCVVDAATNAAHLHGNFPAPVLHAGFGQSTGTVVAAGAFRVAAWALDGQTDVKTGKAGLVLIDAVATCPTRNLVAVGYANGLLSLAEVGKPSEILLREDTGAGITAMAWSANGAYLALAGTDGSAALVEFPDAMFKS